MEYDGGQRFELVAEIQEPSNDALPVPGGPDMRMPSVWFPDIVREEFHNADKRVWGLEERLHDQKQRSAVLVMDAVECMFTNCLKRGLC
jgi:hypothetical protein